MKTPIIILVLLTIPFFCIGQRRLVSINDEDTFWLTKKVEHADFNYAVLDHLDESILNYGPVEDGGLVFFEPVAGKFTYYQFIDYYIMDQYYFLEEEEEPILQKHQEVVGRVPYGLPLLIFRDVLILKTDSLGIIQDGYQFTLGVDRKPYSQELYRVKQRGLKFRDGLLTKELKLSGQIGDVEVVLENNLFVRLSQRSLR